MYKIINKNCKIIRYKFEKKVVQNLNIEGYKIWLKN